MEAIRKALGLACLFHEIRPHKPLPALAGEPFSLVTVTNLVFDRGWNWEEYAFFLRDVASHMNEEGSIYLYFNPPQAEKIWSDPAFLQKFLDAGATCVVDRRALVFNGVNGIKAACHAGK